LEGINRTNRFVGYNPNLIQIEYAQNNGGWKMDLEDENGQNIDMIGNKIFAQPHGEWTTNTLTFESGNRNKAKINVYSLSTSPGEFLIDDV
jgi:hypothetical protein